MERRFPACFVSCSFNPEDAPVASWFEKVLLALEFDPKKADVPQPRPPPEKIADMIRAADCFVAIVTRRTKVEDAELWIGSEWVQNEIGMAYQAARPMAIFVEDGIDPSGLGPWATDYVSFARTDLGASAPNGVRYLVNLRRIVTEASIGRAEDVPPARAIVNELSNLSALISRVDKPTDLPWHMAWATARITGRFYVLPAQVQAKVTAAYAAIERFEELVKPSFAWRKKDEAFSQDKLEQMRVMNQKVEKAVAEAAVELLQLGYPEEWGAIVDAVKKGEIPPSRESD